MQHSSIHWFRKGLRLHDNPALLAAATDCRRLHPLFILDPSSGRAGANARRFLLDALRDLDGSLREMGSRLFVVRGCPEEVLPCLFHAWGTTRLTFEVNTEPLARRRDAAVAELAARHGVDVIREVSHTLYDTERWVPGAVPRGTGDPAPVPSVSLPLPPQSPRLERRQSPPDLQPPAEPPGIPRTAGEAGPGTHTGAPPGLLHPVSGQPRHRLRGPHLGGAGPGPRRGGSSPLPRRGDSGARPARHLHEEDGQCLVPITLISGLLRLPPSRNIIPVCVSPIQAWVCGFKKPETEPTSLSPSTTVLSPYLKFGCLSVRTFWWRLDEVYQGREHSQPPVSLHGQLLWREFFYTAGASIPNFNRMIGNPVCLQVDWDDNPQHLRAWREVLPSGISPKSPDPPQKCPPAPSNPNAPHQGQTGYPFIDAIMTQLRAEGWIHHLARHAVACFLTRGDLWVSWEEGLKVFEELLLDADWSLNAGNWLWLSGSAFFHRYFHVYSPVAFGKKTDRDGAYIRKYLPVLKDFPAEYIYEPWKAPRAVQERAGCLVGTHYPWPIVEHRAASERNLGRMKAARARKGTKREPPASPSVAKSRSKKPKIEQC
ncbi:cryptochrome-2-like isoform 2-T2 [Theristicus caerulescens]